MLITLSLLGFMGFVAGMGFIGWIVGVPVAGFTGVRVMPVPGEAACVNSWVHGWLAYGCTHFVHMYMSGLDLAVTVLLPSCCPAPYRSLHCIGTSSGCLQGLYVGLCILYLEVFLDLSKFAAGRLGSALSADVYRILDLDNGILSHLLCRTPLSHYFESIFGLEWDTKGCHSPDVYLLRSWVLICRWCWGWDDGSCIRVLLAHCCWALYADSWALCWVVPGCLFFVHQQHFLLDLVKVLLMVLCCLVHGYSHQHCYRYNFGQLGDPFDLQGCSMTIIGGLGYDLFVYMYSPSAMVHGLLFYLVSRVQQHGVTNRLVPRQLDSWGLHNSDVWHVLSFWKACTWILFWLCSGFGSHLMEAGKEDGDLHSLLLLLAPGGCHNWPSCGLEAARIWSFICCFHIAHVSRAFLFLVHSWHMGDTGPALYGLQCWPETNWMYNGHIAGLCSWPLNHGAQPLRGLGIAAHGLVLWLLVLSFNLGSDVDVPWSASSVGQGFHLYLVSIGLIGWYSSRITALGLHGLSLFQWAWMCSKVADGTQDIMTTGILFTSCFGWSMLENSFHHNLKFNSVISLSLSHRCYVSHFVMYLSPPDPNMFPPLDPGAGNHRDVIMAAKSKFTKKRDATGSVIRGEGQSAFVSLNVDNFVSERDDIYEAMAMECENPKGKQDGDDEGQPAGVLGLANVGSGVVMQLQLQQGSIDQGGGAQQPKIGPTILCSMNGEASIPNSPALFADDAPIIEEVMGDFDRDDEPEGLTEANQLKAGSLLNNQVWGAAMRGPLHSNSTPQADPRQMHKRGGKETEQDTEGFVTVMHKRSNVEHNKKGRNVSQGIGKNQVYPGRYKGKEQGKKGRLSTSSEPVIQKRMADLHRKFNLQNGSQQGYGVYPMGWENARLGSYKAPLLLLYVLLDHELGLEPSDGLLLQQGRQGMGWVQIQLSLFQVAWLFPREKTSSWVWVSLSGNWAEGTSIHSFCGHLPFGHFIVFSVCCYGWIRAGMYLNLGRNGGLVGWYLRNQSGWICRDSYTDSGMVLQWIRVKGSCQWASRLRFRWVQQKIDIPGKLSSWLSGYAGQPALNGVTCKKSKGIGHSRNNKWVYDATDKLGLLCDEKDVGNRSAQFQVYRLKWILNMMKIMAGHCINLTWSTSFFCLFMVLVGLKVYYLQVNWLGSWTLPNGCYIGDTYLGQIYLLVWLIMYHQTAYRRQYIRGVTDALSTVQVGKRMDNLYLGLANCMAFMLLPIRKKLDMVDLIGLGLIGSGLLYWLLICWHMSWMMIVTYKQPSAEDSFSQPQPPDKPPWVVEQVNTNSGDIHLEAEENFGVRKAAPLEVITPEVLGSNRRYAKDQGRRVGASARVHAARGVRRENKKVRFSPLLSDLRVKEFFQETATKLYDKTLALQTQGTQPPSELDVAPGAATMEVEIPAKPSNQVPMVHSKSIQATANDIEGAGGVRVNKLDVPECSLSKEVEMDLGQMPPTSVLDPISGAGPSDGSLSDYKKSVIMGYINSTKAVPNMVANSWNTAQWNYFTNQCIRCGYEPEYLVVDNEVFMEDHLLDVQSVQPLPANKKQAILKALKSPAKAVKAKHMASWTAAEWIYFKEQVNSLGLDLTYAVEDVEEEDNGMAAIMAGQLFRGWCHLSWKGHRFDRCAVLRGWLYGVLEFDTVRMGVLGWAAVYSLLIGCYWWSFGVEEGGVHMAVWGRATKIGSICMFVVCRSWFMAIWGRCCGTKLDRRRADLVWVVNCFDRGCKWAGFWGCYVVMLCWTMRGRVGLLIVGLLFMLDCFVCRWPDVAQDWLPVADGWPTATCDCLAPVWHGLLWSCYGLQWPNKACCRLYLACCGPCLDPWRLLLVVAGSWYARCGLGWMGSAPCLTLGSPLLAGCGPWSFGFVADLLGWKDIALGPLSGLDMGFHLVNCSLFPLGFLLYMGLWLVGWAYVPLPRFWLEKDKGKGIMADQTHGNMKGDKSKPIEIEGEQFIQGMGFDFSKALGGAAVKPKPSQKGKVNDLVQATPTKGSNVAIHNRFEGLDAAAMDLDGNGEDSTHSTPLSTLAAEGGVEKLNQNLGSNGSPEECSMNKEQEIDLGRVLPSSITKGPITTPDKYGSLSVMGFIKVTHAVPQIVANSWSLGESEYFMNQCHLMGYDPDFLLVDDESFLEDYLLEESLQNTLDQPVNVTHSVPDSKKNAILNALKSKAKAVKAKDMSKWSVGEWLYFVEQTRILKIYMTYAVEDLEEEDNCMASFIAGWDKKN
ncbi:hypothetical protein E3N88_14278 [Mikania micrantha]|uniref:Uncharacterized protein n=1 Tax=Mikania micrantha TaxID=192012 RepID=A0A5N6P295_9ASTR|nr:hypothetical protein E3N88_14278 [Mikania micrantha]